MDNGLKQSPNFIPDTLPGSKESEKKSEWVKIPKEDNRAEKVINEFINPNLEPIAVPLEIYEQKKNYPYIVELLNVKDEKDNYFTKLNAIDALIKYKLEEISWQPTTNAYRDVVNKIKKELKISPNLSNLDTVDRLFHYLLLNKAIYDTPERKRRR